MKFDTCVSYLCDTVFYSKEERYGKCFGSKHLSYFEKSLCELFQEGVFDDGRQSSLLLGSTGNICYNRILLPCLLFILYIHEKQ